jgi:hypothetical protein
LPLCPPHPQGELRLGDFGFAIDNQKQAAFRYCGTLDYMSPEVLDNARGNHDLREIWGPTPEKLASHNLKAYDNKVRQCAETGAF